MKENYLRIEEVAVMVGCSVKTINNWYSFKRAEPENKYAKILPDFTKLGKHGARHWKLEDIPKLVEFKASIPQGRNGILGCVTQKYYKK